jgi:hypothetical protein
VRRKQNGRRRRILSADSGRKIWQTKKDQVENRGILHTSPQDIWKKVLKKGNPGCYCFVGLNSSASFFVFFSLSLESNINKQREDEVWSNGPNVFERNVSLARSTR